MEICPIKICTGCGACAYSCPKQCIYMKENKIGSIYPLVDEDSCIDCGKCKKVCPALQNVGFVQPVKAYAAWDSDEEGRKTSASGGIATQLYNYAIDSNMLAVGAKSNEDFSVTLEIAASKEEIKPFKNSKYVFSTAYSLYSKLKEHLSTGKEVMLIGLPCQIAAAKSLFTGFDNLYLVDLVCHGATPLSYLKQHIKELEGKCGKTAHSMSFRDSKMQTATFTFTLYGKDGECFYAKRTKDGDTYQIGYHRRISYRENCYNCKYARQERISDLTLCDYWGLGKAEPWNFEKEDVSCILVNTQKGQYLIDKLIAEKRILAFERPLTEPISSNCQLQRPTDKEKTRFDFEKYIKLENGNFESAMQKVLKRQAQRENIYKVVSFAKKQLRFLKK